MAKILVIDDDELMNDMIMQLLAEEGYDVESAGNGSMGLKLWAQMGFDLIITDIIMPDKEGLETILEIRQRSKTIPVIAISGGGKLGPGHYLMLAQQFGADHAFQKPFDNRSFLETVRTCLTASHAALAPV